jgi:hypothetical protein
MLRDVLLLSGFGSVLYGSWQFSQPLTFVLGGCAAMAGSFLWASLGHKQ